MLSSALQEVLQELENAGQRLGRPPARLVAAAKGQPAEAIRALAQALRDMAALPAAGPPTPRVAVGENYVQEALHKRASLADLALEWHLIGHLQSNKAGDAARYFDWIQTVDRPKLVDALATHRPVDMPPLNVLIQVNIDDEASKHGCRPDEIDAIATAIAAQPRLKLRGLMAIPAAQPERGEVRTAFTAMKALFDTLAASWPDVDTLSMGMSGDYLLAVEEGATMVRIGTALFGDRPREGHELKMETR